MKLIYLANARIPTEKAHGIQIMQMLKTFANLKLETELLAPRRFNQIKDDPFKYYGIKSNFKIKKLPCFDLMPLGISHLSFWLEMFSFLVFAKVYLMSQKFDILYTREPFAGLFFKDFVLELHCLPSEIKPIHKKIWCKAKKIIVLTNFVKDKLVRNGIPSDKILVAPDGVDLEKFQISANQEECRRKLNLPQNKKIVLYTGHLFEWKGSQTLAETSQFLSEDVEIYFVGGTQEDIKKFKIKNFSPKADQPRAEKSKIKVVGHRPYGEIPYWLASADVLVLPNSAKEKISVYYTSPLKLFEYLASGRPIVASNLPSIREILNQGNAILVKPDDPQILADGINLALQKSVVIAKISEQARSDALKYSWQKRAEKILNFLMNQ